ncbi:response regulator transcription factor [Paenibacillus agricola]|uniref:Response regulator n=1 Tax=Paenibacillus agricola TaxID=2716264 RepID=A0ABX0JDP8_9BACL|nr:response regulator [Paenibacillus agricola]NHN34642.1 response regulator [Paenibacillus agricola]
MKVLIVDDEEHVREGIMLALDWEKIGVQELLFAENGLQALELIKLHDFAVIFCDMNMPGMDGTELLLQLRQFNQTTQIIVVSGYDNFAYTHAALLAKGVDYLLKPLRTRELVQSLERAMSAWKEQTSHLDKDIEAGEKLRRANALLDEQKLVGYFKGETAFNEEIRRLFSRRGLRVNQVKVALILPINRSELLYDRFRGDSELLIFSLNNIAHEVLNRYGAHYLCRLDDYQWLLLTFSEDPMGENQHHYYLEKVASSWLNTLGLKVLVGLHEGVATVENLPEAIGGARFALQRCDILNNEPGNNVLSHKLPRLTEQQLLLHTAFTRKDKSLAVATIRSFTRILRERMSLRLRDLQGFTHEANLMLEKMGGIQHAEMKTTNKIIPLWIADLDEWERLLIDLYSSLIDESEGEFSARSIEAIYDYITNHYEEDISLSMLGAKFNFNPWYISRKFKEIYKTTVITYLTQLRIGKSKSLLSSTNISVSEMANMLGYTDENYFSKVFKKQTGISPLQFRKSQRDENGQNPEK